jgi:hypothetical protein
MFWQCGRSLLFNWAVSGSKVSHFSNRVHKRENTSTATISAACALAMML